MNNEKILLKDMGITDTGNVSDGYHTFDELYEHRTVLFSVICNICSHLDLDVNVSVDVDDMWVWKSVKHSDGTLLDGWFLAGITVPDGQITYHVDIKYWDMFENTKVDRAPLYDGHTSEEVLKRIKSAENIAHQSITACVDEIDILKIFLGQFGWGDNDDEIQ